MSSKAKDSSYSLDPISAVQIAKYLSKLGIGPIEKLEVYPSVGSTNDHLSQKKYLECKEIAICIAEQQTHGRGRYGHQWYSPPGTNLYMSILWPIKNWSKKFELLGLLQLIAFANLLTRLEVNEVKLKWPNDICIQNKKLGGILIDKIACSTGNCLIIGIGLNVAMSKLNELAISTPWTDLITVQPSWDMTRDQLAALLIFETFNTLDALAAGEDVNLHQEWHKYDLLYNQEMEFIYRDQRHTAIAKGIDESGNIIIETDDKLLHLHSSQVSDIKL